MHVGELWRYPVKSLAGERVEAVEIGLLGLEGDRVVRVRGATGRRITARQFPGLLGLKGTLRADGTPLVDGVPWHEAHPAVRSVTVADAQLIRDDSRVRFDVLPVSVATDGALAALDIDRRRLRPNIVLAGVEGLEERSWSGLALRVGAATVGVVQVRGRCVMTTYDPDTLDQDQGVLRRIVDDYDGRFALDCYVVGPGRVAVGDEAVLLGYWTIGRGEAQRQLGAVRPVVRAG
jgi:MOSC domain-containing protein